MADAPLTSTATSLPQVAAALTLGSLTASVAVYKLCADRVLRASTAQCFEKLRVETPSGTHLVTAASAEASSPPADDNSTRSPSLSGDAPATARDQREVNAPPPSLPSTIAVIIGWGGAQPKHLNRLRDLYHNKGFATLVSLPSMTPFFENGVYLGGGCETLLAVRDYLQRLKEEGGGSAAASTATPPPTRIIFHLHSNTAVYFYYVVARLMRYSIFKEIADAFSGVVYDSTPGHPSLSRIPIPKGFQQEVNTFVKDHPLAKKPFLLRKSVADVVRATAAADVIPTTPLTNDADPILFIGAPSALLPHAHLPADTKRWKSISFGQNNAINPFVWASWAFLVSFVMTPLIVKRPQYVHWFWTPVSFLVLFKEYAHTAIRYTHAYSVAPMLRAVFPQNNKAVRFANQETATAKADSAEDLLITRYEYLFSPHVPPAIKRCAELLAESKEDGYHQNLKGALHHLYAVVVFDNLVNRDVEAPCRVPELFLYSGSDKLVLEADVLWYLWTRCSSSTTFENKTNKVPAIFLHKFDKSPHVAHLLKHPEAYSNCLDNFLRFAIDAKNASKSGIDALPDLEGCSVH